MKKPSIILAFACIGVISLLATSCGGASSSSDEANDSASVSTEASTSETFTAAIPIALPAAQTGVITFANILDHISEIPMIAWQNTEDVIAASTVATPIENNVLVGPNTQIDVEGGLPRVQEVLLRSEKLWGGFSQVEKFYLLMYNAQDVSWAGQEWTKIGSQNKYFKNDVEGSLERIAGNCQQTLSPGVFEGTPSNCRGADSSAIANSDDAILSFGQGGEGASNDRMITTGGIVGHEYGHSVQAAQWIGKPNTYCTEQTNSRNCNRSGQALDFAPCWLMEGQGNSVGWMSAAETFEKYQALIKDRPYSQGPSTITDYTQPSLRSYLFDQVPGECTQNGDLYSLGYTVGAQVVEALTAIAGPQSTMALYALGAQGQDFPTAFQSVYGISWDEASTILSKVVAAQYATFGSPPK